MVLCAFVSSPATRLRPSRNSFAFTFDFCIHFVLTLNLLLYRIKTRRKAGRRTVRGDRQKPERPCGAAPASTKLGKPQTRQERPFPAGRESVRRQGRGLDERMAGGPGGCVVPPGSRSALGTALESERDALGLLAASHSNFLENESSRQGKAGRAGKRPNGVWVVPRGLPACLPEVNLPCLKMSPPDRGRRARYGKLRFPSCAPFHPPGPPLPWLPHPLFATRPSASPAGVFSESRPSSFGIAVGTRSGLQGCACPGKSFEKFPATATLPGTWQEGGPRPKLPD